MLDSHGTFHVLPGNEASPGLGVFHPGPGVFRPGPGVFRPARSPAGLHLVAPRASLHALRTPGSVLCPASLRHGFLCPESWRPAYPVDSSSLEVPVVGCWGRGLAVAARAAESLDVVEDSPRGLRRVMGVSEGLGPVVDRAEVSVRTAAGREGSLDTVEAPDAEDEGSGVTGAGPGAPGEAGGRVKVPRETDGPAEGRGDWEASGSPGRVASGPTGGEGEARAPAGLMGEVCT